MMLSTVAVLRPGDWVHYDGSEHQVLALAGTSVRLRTVDGADSVVLAGHLMASPGFAVVDSESAPSVEPFALLDSLQSSRPSGRRALRMLRRPGDFCGERRACCWEPSATR